MPLTTPTKPLRSDGAEARNRLLDAAMRLFAEHGFAKTSTRDIAEAAQVNISSISYYFGDKAGLYRAVFTDPRSNPDMDPQLFDDPNVPLATVIKCLLGAMVEPLKTGDLMECCAKLHFREMLEPTGVWLEEIDRVIKPAHTGLVRLLCRHLGVALDTADANTTDDDVHRLAFSITGLAVTLMVSGDPMKALRPSLLATPQAIDTYIERMADYAMAMFHAEKLRRNATPPLK
jgi:TetR/AcrR family transcriptional regulator, regulator of cefoperazone and chloramphenicol sensitivity